VDISAASSSPTTSYFPSAYASKHGGLATAMPTLIFLYILAVIFLPRRRDHRTIIAAKRRRLHKLHDQHFQE
jgi:hypothetical protein